MISSDRRPVRCSTLPMDTQPQPSIYFRRFPPLQTCRAARKIMRTMVSRAEFCTMSSGFEADSAQKSRCATRKRRWRGHRSTTTPRPRSRSALAFSLPLLFAGIEHQSDDLFGKLLIATRSGRSGAGPSRGSQHGRNARPGGGHGTVMTKVEAQSGKCAPAQKMDRTVIFP